MDPYTLDPTTSHEAATAFLRWFNAKKDEYHYLARFKSSTPFVVAYPDACFKAEQARFRLGKSKWNRPWPDVYRVEGVPLCKWINARRKYGPNGCKNSTPKK